MTHRPTAICEANLRLLSDFWHLRIIEELASTPLRYCELQRALHDVNPATLTKKLGVLEGAGLIERSELHDQHVTYGLTKRGAAALPVLVAIKNFAKP